MDNLREMVNAGMGKAASSLNLLLDSPIELEIPSISLFKQEELLETRKILGNHRMSCVRMGFSGPVAGSALLVFSQPSAARLVATLVSQDTTLAGLNAIMTETLKEVGNIIINSVVGTIGNFLKKPIELSLPDYLEGSLEDLLKPEAHPDSLTLLMMVRTRFRAQDRQIDGNIFLIFEIGETVAMAMTHNDQPT